MQQIHAAICTPIQSPDGVIGVIYADNVQSEKSLTRDDLKLVAAIGVITGIAIRNARLVERLKNEKAALEESHVALKTAQDQLVQSEKLAVTGWTSSRS